MMAKNLLVPTTILICALGLGAVQSSPAAAPARMGTVRFRPTPHESSVAKHFHLEPHEFAFTVQRRETASKVFELSEVTFPSPVVTAEPNNNMVHCEYFCPTTQGKHPGVIVLHILGGDFDLSRLFCRALAQRGASALFVIMPYYGPRKQPDSSARMVSIDPRQTVRGMTQAVLDIRRAAAWLGAQSEVDDKQLGILGVSLGGITGGLAATAEPRLSRVCLILAGGDMGQIAWESPHLARVRERWVAEGGTRESLLELMRSVDPCTFGANVQGRKILMLNARRDEVIPPACSTALWNAFGKPEIHWWDAGHYSAAWYLFVGLDKVTKFFVPEARPQPANNLTTERE